MTHYPCGTGNDFSKVFGEGRSRFSELEALPSGEAIRASHLEMAVVPGGLNFIFPANMAYFENQNEKSKENKSDAEISAAI